MSSPPPLPGAPISSAPIEPGRASGGCARGVLIGCGAASLLVLVLLGIFVAYVRRKPEALTDLMMGQIERNFAPDVTTEEKEKLRTAYAGFRTRLREHRVGAEPMERLRRILSNAATGSVSRDQVRELTDVFSSPATAPSGDIPAGPPVRPAPTPALSPAT